MAGGRGMELFYRERQSAICLLNMLSIKEIQKTDLFHLHRHELYWLRELAE